MTVSRELLVTPANQGSYVLTTRSTDLFIPPDHFSPGTVAARSLGVAPAAGRLECLLETDVQRDSAEGLWNYGLVVNGIIEQRWTGAALPPRTRVTLHGLNQGDRVGFQVTALMDRRSRNSWSKATRARLLNPTFHIEPADTPMTVTSHPPDPWFRTWQGTLRTNLSHVRALPEGTFELEQPTRVDVVTEHCVVPLLVVRRKAASRLVVLCNGAVDLERTQSRPVFQRSSWWREIRAHQIYVCDPGTVGPRALSLNWSQIRRGYWAIPDTSAIVMSIAEQLGAAETADRMYFGSSAGGFQALALAHFDPCSRAVINNAQMDWTRWMAGAVNSLRAARFDNLLPATIRQRYPGRSSVLRLLASGQELPTVDYLVNVASGHDSSVDLPAFSRFRDVRHQGAERLHVHEYRDAEAGHNPLPRDVTLAWLNDSPEREQMLRNVA